VKLFCTPLKMGNFFTGKLIDAGSTLSNNSIFFLGLDFIPESRSSVDYFIRSKIDAGSALIDNMDSYKTLARVDLASMGKSFPVLGGYKKVSQYLPDSI